ncbi:hypothetical protein R5R35_014530 [Gryllus longicercus]|uniref:Rho GTPase activating protein n=1 Tax=Gryllus longicercus TaxID=2509291 RepID=A0AAN9YZ20_9ORTH
MDTVGCKLKVLYDFEYETKDKRKICITRGEKLFLIRKTNHDWWQVIKNSSERPFFVPAPYVIEASECNVEDSYVDNPIYGKPPNLGLVCDCGKASDIGGGTNVPYIKHTEEQEQLKVHQSYVHSTTIDSDFHTLSVDGCEASSSCESGAEKKNAFLENSGLAHGGVTKSALGNYLLAETQHCAPCNEDNKFTDENPVAALTFTLSSDKREILRTNMAENISCDVSKETSNVNIGKIKSKLAKSRSFKTKNELQKLSRLDPESWVLLPVERTVVKPDSVLETFSSENFNKNNKNCDFKVGDVYESATKEGSSQPAPALVTVPVPLVFHNELYDLSNSQDGDTNKTMDSGNISSESLFTHEEDISDSGASHKSGLISSAQSRESIHEHSDLLADDTSKEELESSREEIYFAEDYEGVPIPQGWSRVYDEDTGEYCYVNEVTQAKWFSSTDGKGRVYYFEENSNVSTWTLPNIVVANEEEASGELQLESSNLPLRNQDGEKKSRVGKARSLFLSDPKHKETTSKSSSIPRNWLQLYGLDKDVLKYGNMNRTKITENGKKMSKRWASAYVVLTEDAICFYKDLKNSQHSVGLQPELSMQLSGARVESGEKLSSRKHVFLITSGSLQLLCECDSAEGAAQWRSAITDAIVRLAKPVVTPPAKISQDKPKTASIGRSKSLQVKNREGAFDDATSTEEQQMKIRDRLKKFFNRRPTREILASKGIYKDEPVFDSHLEKVCPSRPPFIPDFVRLCVTAIESKEENMKTDGLYRASGNLSHVQKIRLQVDQNNLCVLEAEEDVHVLTGALKLFFRELKEPLIPYELFNEAIDAGGMNGSKKEKVKLFRDIVKKLPPQNHDTLKFLLQHLRRVTKYEEFNRMHVPNLAIVFGPTLMWREKEYHQNMAIEYMQQNLVIEFFLQQFDEIFR